MRDNTELGVSMDLIYLDIYYYRLSLYKIVYKMNNVFLIVRLLIMIYVCL